MISGSISYIPPLHDVHDAETSKGVEGESYGIYLFLIERLPIEGEETPR